jgi:sugar/nucleoside kinase (ribokinase family)
LRAPPEKRDGRDPPTRAGAKYRLVTVSVPAADDLQLVTIGHAIVDVLAHADDAFLGAHDLTKGKMELIDEARAVPIYSAMAGATVTTGGDITELSGGSAANTAVVAAMLGARTCFIGKVRDDALGHTFAHDLEHVGVRFATTMAGPESLATGRCLINVTPDAERTMCTFLGAARGLRVPDMDTSSLSAARVTYVEGYLWDELNAHEALEVAIERVHAAGRMFSFTLSDSFLVDRFRKEFLDLCDQDIDILFANEHELCSLFETTDLDDAVARIGEICEIATITRGSKGSLVVHGSEVISVEAAPVVSTTRCTGAGDAYAGGFLYGFVTAQPLRRCAEMGNLAAGEVIGRMGARPSTDLAAMVHQSR